MYEPVVLRELFAFLEPLKVPRSLLLPSYSPLIKVMSPEEALFPIRKTVSVFK
jgi:hypothetical protein